MNKSLLVGVGVGIIIAAAAGAVASYSSKHSATNSQAVITPIPARVNDALATPDAAKHEPAVLAVAAPATPIVASAATPARSAAPQPREKHNSVATTSNPQFAHVVSSTPVVQTERVPRESCHDEQVTRQKAVKDEKRVAGAALGALVGGVLGNQVGGGDGRKLATAAGAIAGGVAGSKIQRRMQESNTEIVTEKRCTTVYDTKEKVLGYDVAYRIGDQTRTQRMSTAAEVGAKLPLNKDGHLVAGARSGS